LPAESAYVPTTATEYVPSGVVPAVVTCSVEVADGDVLVSVTGLVLKVAIVPAGQLPY
jgi:hypothetical protein